VAFFAAILTFFSGFGLGTILTPVMMVFFPVDIAIAFTGIVHFSNNIFKLFIVGNKADKKVLLYFGIPAIIAAFVGSYLLVIMDTNYIMYSFSFFGNVNSVSYVKFLVSLLLIVFALMDLIPFFKKLEFREKNLPIGGVLKWFFWRSFRKPGCFKKLFSNKIKFKERSVYCNNCDYFFFC